MDNSVKQKALSYKPANARNWKQRKEVKVVFFIVGKWNIENFFVKIGAEKYRALKRLGSFRESKDSKEM
jgi:hypothetical protein